MLWLASWEFLLAVRVRGLGLPRGSSLMTNWIYFSNWRASRKISIVSGSMICPYSCCWSGSVVPLRTCIKDMLYLTYGRLWMAAIYSYYLNLPNSGSCLITVLHSSAWKTLHWILTAPLSMFCACGWRWSCSATLRTCVPRPLAVLYNRWNDQSYLFLWLLRWGDL